MDARFQRLIAVVAAGVLAAALAGAAQGQGLPPLPTQATDALNTATEPAPYLRQQTSGTVEADTDYTPIVKESPFFSLHQGAYYRDEGNGGAESEEEYKARREANASGAAELVTAWDDELTDVAFTNTRNGFAGGQRKIDCVAADGSPGTDGVPDTYVPAIYRYGDSPSGIRWLRPTASQGGLLGDCDKPGFIGQIAWFQETGMAIAVGGTGSYPYRAPAYADRDPGTGEPCNLPGIAGITAPFGHNCDRAGLGRAFLYNHGAWEELDTDDATFPNDGLQGSEKWGETLHGMTALDCSPLPTTKLCFAGGLGQIWPVLVTTDGLSDPCAATDANACLRFPADGKIPGLCQVAHGATSGQGCHAPTVGKFDINSRDFEYSPEPIPTDGSSPVKVDPVGLVLLPAFGCSGAAGNANRVCQGDTDSAYRFRFRVRQIRMDRGHGASNQTAVGAAAVTDGCCAGDPSAAATGSGAQLGPAHNYPSVLLFDQVLGGVFHTIHGGRGWRWQLWSADVYGQAYEHYAHYGVPDEQRRALGGPPNTRPDWPDSFYALGGFIYSALNNDSRISLVASPGGPPLATDVPERPSLVSEPICMVGDLSTGSASAVTPVDVLDWPQPGLIYSALRAQLASVRLVDGDGDELAAMSLSLLGIASTQSPPAPLAGAPSNLQRTSGFNCGQGAESRPPNAGSTGDAVPDWSVGELRSTDQGDGARGLAFSTVSRPELVPGVVSVGWDEGSLNYYGDGGFADQHLAIDPARVIAALADPVNNPPTRQEKLIAYLQSQHFFTGSYALGSIDFLDGTGSGWAVGAHGAIVQLGSASEGLASKAKVEPEPPPLGAKRPGQAPERTPYEELDPPTTAPGALPPLAARPPERLAEHALRSVGSPDNTRDYANTVNDLDQLILSRDGAEGWGLGGQLTSTGKPQAMTLFHYAGGEWRRCDPEGVPGALEPDPACAALAGPRAYKRNGAQRGVKMNAAARIPYENDSDATNDDEVEIFAFGSGYRDWEAEPGGTRPGESKSVANTWKVSPTLFRYRAGAWEVEDDPETSDFLGSTGRFNFNTNYTVGGFGGEQSLAFAAPDDGWALGSQHPIAGPPSLLVHFDGERWVDCNTAKSSPDPYNVSDVAFSDGTTAPEPTPAARRARWCEDPEARTISADVPPPGGAPNCLSNGQQDCDTFTGLISAGGRLYLYGYREVGDPNPADHPLILCKDAGGPWRAEGCGFDPGFAVRDPHGEGGATGGLQGRVSNLSVVVDSDGVARGWARGFFGADARQTSSGIPEGVETTLMRLDASGWHPYHGDWLPNWGEGGTLVALPDGGGLIDGGHRFDRTTGNWQPLTDSVGGTLAVPDNRGGAWLPEGFGTVPRNFVHYTKTPPKPLFTEAPTPLPRREETFTALAGQPGGALWATTTDGALYRYARSTGWDRVPVPGWAAKGSTVAFPAYAVAVNDSGVGVAVGREGRIADIEGSEVQLDPAAGTLCDLAKPIEPQVPCGTSRHLRSVAVSPDGAAIAGGDNLSLLWRPPSGEFRAISKPEAANSATIFAAALPEAGTAYLTTDQGQLFRGRLGYRGDRCEQPTGDGRWCWKLENTDSGDRLLTRDPSVVRKPASLNALALDADGHGLAVGARGTILERTAGCDSADAAARCWRLLRSGTAYNLTAVLQRGEHALVGGTHGLVLTRAGERFAIARAPDRFSNNTGVSVPGRDPYTDSYTGAVVGLALSGGVEKGQVEVWAATDASNSGLAPNTGRLFHYASHPAEPLLDPARTAAGPLADSPAPRPGETSFAALGKTECHIDVFCGLSNDYAVLSRRATEAIAARSRQPGGPELAVFTGDFARDAGGSAGATFEDVGVGEVFGGVLFGGLVQNELPDSDAVTVLRAMRDWLAEPLEKAELPFYAALGAQDLSLPPGFHFEELVRAGTNDAWREAFAGEPAPWGKGKRFASDRHEVRPVGSSGSSLTLPAPKLEAADREVEVKAVSGGARTHYAFDLLDKESGRKLVRFAFADNSLKSLALSDPIQHPTELEAGERGSGQAGWLRRVLCEKGKGSRCSRDPGQPAVVVANAPTYNYANGDQRFWAKDAAVFESVLLQENATAVIAGSLGWNGRYWAVAPGLHVPCQGEPYQEVAPAPGEASCRGRSSSELPLGVGGIAPIANQLAGSLGAAGPAIDQASDEVNAVAGEGLLPFVVASGAGGALQGQGASDGYFHGYSIVRVPGDGNPAGVLVEQRPHFEFLQITAASHVLRPGQKMTLRGVGRGPLVLDSSVGGLGQPQVAAFDAIDSAAVTHRYALVEADPAKPWLPRCTPSLSSRAEAERSEAEVEGSCSGSYVPLDPSIATIDSVSGAIKVGRGNNPRTFALGVLSVGCSGTQADADGTCDPDDPGVHVATFPLLFESRRTFKPAVVESAPLAQIRAQAQAVLPQPPNPPQPPAVKGVELPSPPGVPAPPPVNVPNVQVPAPPIPPPPPVGQSPVPLDLSASAPTLQIAPQTTVIPPPAPPIQPAPPGGARREARQRQSATQSSGSGSGSEQHDVDIADKPESPMGTAQMTRIDRARADGGSMTAYYGASVTLLALIAAFGWNYGRPGPRRGSPVEPAPARAWARRR